MPMSMRSTPPIASLQRTLGGRGFAVTAAVADRGCRITPGIAGQLQFGHDVTTVNGVTTAVVSAVASIADMPHADVSRWLIGKRFVVARPGGRIDVVLDLELFLGDAAWTGSLRSSGRGLYRLLRQLLADLRVTLSEPVGGRQLPSLSQAGPTAHLDFMVLGDLTAGRCGLVATSPRGDQAARHLRRRVCDLLITEVLPDMARALRAAANASQDRNTAPQTGCDVIVPAAGIAVLLPGEAPALAVAEVTTAYRSSP